MFGLRHLFGNRQERQLAPFRQRVARINALEPEFKALSDEELRAKTSEFRSRIDSGATLDQLLEPSFATVREAARRSLGLRHYDVQLMGAMVLHQGAIAEMRTGEGKTLMATAPVYLNALAGKGVHVVTVNDYLAERDAEWMGQVYRALGLEVGVITHEKADSQRREAYAADVTYGTNNEFGFDYLRDNMKYSRAEMAQRQHSFAIVDEVDSILIDESRTPLIISGPTDDRSELYQSMDTLIPKLDETAFDLDEKHKSVSYTEEGTEQIETLMLEAGILEGSLFEPANIALIHHANQALRAHKLFQKDRDYIVKDGAVVLIDEFTGRMTPGRRMSEGLHQAIEAREGCQIQPENQTLASITFQNYFRLYDKLSGMTGTAMTEAAEFADIYALPVIQIPTNEPVRRVDEDDVVFLTAEEKYKIIVEDIAECREKGQPVLVGTVSIEKSEMLSRMLTKKGIVHEVLNARYHEREAHIIAQAGVPGAITVATNMAGRGTDIQLGGNFEMRLEDEMAAHRQRGEEPDEAACEALQAGIREDIETKRQEALSAGGLYVLGTERHESRRIDNQLRGRTGRQGDPGKSQFYVCLEDDLLRIFAADKMDAMMRRFGMREDEAIVHPWMSKALETSQKRVEQRNFEIRKNLLKYDDVINNQRRVIFSQRLDFIEASHVSDTVRDMRHDVVEDMATRHILPRTFSDQWQLDSLEAQMAELSLQAPVRDWAAEEGVASEEMKARLIETADTSYARKTADIGEDRMQWLEKQVLLTNIDGLWREHLSRLDQLRSVIHLRGFAQRDPLNEFKSEAFVLFESLLSELRIAVTSALFRVSVVEEAAPPPDLPGLPEGLVEVHADADGGASGPEPETTRRAAPASKPESGDHWRKVPRNAPCPCGSGRKFKHCHGSVAAQRARV